MALEEAVRGARCRGGGRRAAGRSRGPVGEGAAQGEGWGCAGAHAGAVAARVDVGNVVGMCTRVGAGLGAGARARCCESATNVGRRHAPSTCLFSAPHSTTAGASLAHAPSAAPSKRHSPHVNTDAAAPCPVR